VLRFLAPLVLVSTVAAAQPLPAETVARTGLWPYALNVHLLVGAEPHDQGTPVAFGIGAEVLWHATVGAFLGLFGSEGTPIVVKMQGSTTPPSLADRVSVPFGLALRPLAWLGLKRADWGARLAAGVGLQIGPTVEHLRVSDADETTAGLHLALSVDVPLYGGPVQGGVAIRLYGRLLVTPDVSLDEAKVHEPIASGQLYVGMCWYP
jgi:hypothetical protein